ncbi:hypothetical protein LCGC14_0263390 [marine sediment metagenome]|uniref:GHMP kinase n=1 Tax=marine sediment metagenome TaxID=412755 RepID=A0A0F9U633_9ZZZZ
MIMSRAPMRISFAGGGSDINAFASKYGGCVVSATITRYVTVRMEQGGNQFVSYPIDETEPEYLAKLAKRLGLEVSLETRIDAPPRSGLGTSGALGVAMIGCLNTLLDRKLDRNGIIEMAYRIETEEMGIAGGKQDQYASCWGGLNLITFGYEEVTVTPLVLKPETLLTLESSLILIFIHSRRESSSRIMEHEARRVEQSDPEVLEALHRQRELAKEAANALLNNDITAFGNILDEAWQTKKKQTPLVTNDVIDAIYSVARRAGALGGKLSGAGGGGYMFLFAPGKEGDVAEALRTIGLRPENVTFDWRGLTVW